MYVQYMQGLVSPGSVQQIICSLHYNSKLETWMVVHLTATKLKPLKFSMSRFALHYIADISITMILYDFLLFPA
jgi:hypothetical protein